MRHSPAEGTTLHGTSKRDGSAEALRSVAHVARWRWSDTIDCWYIVRSRDRRAYRYQLDETAAALRRAGFEVVVEQGQERRPVAEQEAERAQRAATRAGHLTERAARLHAAGEAGWAAAREYAALLPLGQPILADHYSAPRHRRDLARIDRIERRAVDQLNAGDDAARRAETARAHQAHREHGATTLRRIQKLEAELRRAQRGMAQRPAHATDGERDADVGHWTSIVQELEEKLAYWRGYLRGLEDAGVYKVWSAADFTHGDYVRSRHGWSPVQRVNAKSVTIPHIHAELAEHGHTWLLPYDEVLGQASADEWARAQKHRETDVDWDL